MAFVITPKKTHIVELTNEEFHYVSELLANRLQAIPKELQKASLEWTSNLDKYIGKEILFTEKEKSLTQEENLIDYLISEKFISI